MNRLPLGASAAAGFAGGRGQDRALGGSPVDIICRMLENRAVLLRCNGPPRRRLR